MKFTFFIVLFFPLLLQAQVSTKAIDNKIHKSFLEANAKFLAFEIIHGHFIETKNASVHYLAWGNPSNTPLIWLHGSLSSGYELLPFADNLVKAGYYVIAIDYYGHGQTSIPDHEVSLYHVADDIKYLMDSLKIDKAVIGGWSRGGFISTAFYDAYPEKVLGLILEDGGAVSINTHYHKMEVSELENRLKLFDNEQIADTSYSTAFDAYHAFHDKNDAGDQFELLTWIRQDRRGNWVFGPGLWKLFNISNYKQAMDNIFRPTLSPLFAESMAIIEPKIIYRNLHVPMLILDPVSKDDLFPFEKENDALKKQHPDLICHKIFEDTGHNIHGQRPEQFTTTVISFLHRVKSGN